MLLIEAMIDDWCIGIRRICIDTFSLCIIEVKLLIVIFHGNDGSISLCGTLFRVEGLQPLPVVILCEANIIDIIMEIGIFLNALMESLEGIVQIGLFDNTMCDRVESHVHTITNVVVEVLHLVVVDAVLSVSAVKTYHKSEYVNKWICQWRGLHSRLNLPLSTRLTWMRQRLSILS